VGSGDLIAVLAAVAVVLVTAVSGISVYLSSRRNANGKVATTEAAVLWQQAQDMRTMLIAEKTRAEEQRDRLIASYTQNIVPVLSEVNSTVIDLAETVAEILAVVRGNQASLEGGGHASPPDLPSPVRQD
jgi:uncharacterized membrane protein